MLKKLLFLVLLFLVNFSFAQTEIKAEEIKNYVGQSVLVKAKVVSIYDKGEKVVILDMVESYPNSIFGVVFQKEDLEQFKEVFQFVNKEVVVTGNVELYPKFPKEGKKQKIQIVLNSIKQIRLAD